MSKVLPATCLAGVVTCEGLPVPGVTILSEGLGQSSGLLILEEDSKTYVATNSTDIDGLLSQVTLALTDVANCLENLDNSGFWIAESSPKPPVLGPTITSIRTEISNLNIIKGALK